MDAKKNSSDVFANYKEIKTDRALEWEKTRSEAYKEYRKKWVEYPKNLTIPNFPMHMDIELSSFCNLRCPFCARTERVKAGVWRKNKNMELETFKKIIDEGAKEGLCAINLNNYGEPLINPDIIEMVRYAKSKGILDVFFHTNGVLLNREMSQNLIEAGLDRIVISVDTPYKEKYEKLRVRAKYDEVMKNIQDMFDVRKEMNSITPLIRINMIRFPDQSDQEIEDMKTLFLDKIDVLGFLELDDHKDELNKDKKKDPDLFPTGYKSKFICSQLISRFTILENGDVCPCCIDIDATLRLGDANTDSLKGLWESKKLQELRRIHMEGKFYMIPTCRNCDWAVKEDRRLRNEEIANKDAKVFDN